MIAAGIAIFFVVRLLLPTGEEALPPFAPIAKEPPPPVFSVAVPKPAGAGDESADVVVVVAEPGSQPVAVPRSVSAAKPRPALPPRAHAVTRSVPPPAPPPAPAPTPAPPPAPAPEPPRVLARAAAAPAPAGNRSPGRAKHDNGPPPGQAQSSPQAPQDMNPTAAEAVLEPHGSPGREKHDKGLPPGLEKQD